MKNEINTELLEKIIESYQELVIYLKAFGITHLGDESYENNLLSKIVSLQSELAALKSQQEIPNWICQCGEISTGSTKIWACHICGKEVPESANPDILSKVLHRNIVFERLKEKGLIDESYCAMDKVNEICDKVEQEEQSKGAINTLNEYCGSIVIPFNEQVTLYYPAVIQAMQAYHNEGRREIVKDWCKFLYENEEFEQTATPYPVLCDICQSYVDMGKIILERKQPAQQVVSDEEIIQTIPYPKPMSEHQIGINTGWIRHAKWARDYGQKPDKKLWYGNIPR